MTNRWLGFALLGSALMSGGCLAGEPEPGEGIYARFDQEYLQAHGFPYLLNQSYWWPASGEGEWGLLYDDEGIPYGPNSLYHFKRRLDHPDLAVTDSTMTGRWFAINRHRGLTEEMFGRWLELMDLAWVEYAELFNYRPQHRVQVFATDKLYEYKAITGHDYWATHAVEGPNIVFEPIDILFKRGLAYGTARNAVALVFVDMKCNGQAPQWFRQGIACYLGQEGNYLLNFIQEFRAAGANVLVPPDVVAKHIFPLVDREQGRIALFNSFLMVWHMSESWGWDKVRQTMDEMENGASFDQAVQTVYGMSEEQLLDRLDSSKIGSPVDLDFEPTFP